MAEAVELFDSEAQRTTVAHRCATNDSVVEDKDDNNDNDYGNMQVFTVRFISSQIYYCTQAQGAWFMRMLPWKNLSTWVFTKLCHFLFFIIAPEAEHLWFHHITLLLMIWEEKAMIRMNVDRLVWHNYE